MRATGVCPGSGAARSSTDKFDAICTARWRCARDTRATSLTNSSPPCHPRNLAHTDSKAVTPINPAAQKFHRLILCNLLDNSVTLAASSVPGLSRGKCQIADANQHVAEIQPVISAAVSMSDLMIRAGIHSRGRGTVLFEPRVRQFIASESTRPSQPFGGRTFRMKAMVRARSTTSESPYLPGLIQLGPYIASGTFVSYDHGDPCVEA
jgi:hypothetical protein